MNLEQLIDILEEFKDLDRASVTTQTTFEQLGLDSLDVVDFIMKIEETCGVAVPMDKELIKSIGDVVDYISQHK